MVPLSEEEERILREIENGFYASDPELAHDIASTSAYSGPSRNLKIFFLLFGVSLVVLIAGLVFSVWIAFVGFLGMLFSALGIEKNIRQLGKIGWNDVSRSFSERNLASFFRSRLQNYENKSDSE